MTDAANLAPAPPSRSRLVRRRAVRWLISVAAVTFVIWMLPFRDRCTADGCQDGLFTTFRRIDLPLLVAIFGVYVLGSFAWSIRWRALLRLAGVELSLGAAWRVTLEAQAGGILLPGGVAGDALRIAYAKERAPAASLAKITASILADRMVGLATLSTLAFSFAMMFGASKDLAVALPMLAGIPVFSLVVGLVLRRPGLRDARFVQSKLGQRFVLPVLEYVASPTGPRVLVKSFLWSLFVSGIQLAVVRGLVATVGSTPTSEGSLQVGVAFSMIVAAVPVTPGGWGTADAAYVFFLGRAGVAPAQAAAVCLLYRLMWYATGSMGAVSAFARTNRE